MSERIGQLTVIGVGLIGSSLARAARQQGLVEHIVGCGRDRAHLDTALRLGVVDRAETDPAAAVAGADVVMVAVPLGAMRQVFAAIKDSLPAGAVLTDAGSAKASVVADAQAVFGELPPGFVPGHPIAGTEKSGVEAGFAELYQNRCVILTPLASSADWAVARITDLWRGVGAEVVTMSPRHHDEVLAATSHLPHVLAFALVDTLGRMQERAEIFKYAAGGFRDFTRIASSDPDVWRDICLANGDALLAALDKYKDELEALAEAIRRRDREAIEVILRRAKSIRDQNVIS